jgi:long-chain acyl-CoA synthetase
VTTAVARLAALAAAQPDAVALSDGERWWTRREVLARVEAVSAGGPDPVGDGGDEDGSEDAGEDGDGPHEPEEADDRSVVVARHCSARGIVAVLAAERSGRVPVVTDAAWPAADRRDLCDAVRARRGAPSGEPLLTVLTSGSTGRPRAVVRTAASWAASLRSFDVVSGVRDGDVVWAPGPLCSTLTLFAGWHALATGRPLVTGRWRGVAATPRAADATVVHAVPAVVADVLAAAAAGDLPRLRLAVVAGAHVPAGLREQARLAGVRLVEYYGAAELSFVAADADGRGLRPFPGCRVQLRDARGGPVPAWTEGEVWVSSPYLAQGYLGTDARDGGPLRRDGGWASVGDRARMRPDGALEVIGRGEAAVEVGGHTVPVADVEAVLRAVPGVLEVACVGERHAHLGNRLVAAVRAVPGTDPVPQLKAAARASLPRAARPSRWVLLDDMPRTSGGKLARGPLADLLNRPVVRDTP